MSILTMCNIKNMTPLVYSECVLKAGDSGHWQIQECVYANLVSFIERILSLFDIYDTSLSNRNTHENKMLCVQQGFPSKPLS